MNNNRLKSLWNLSRFYRMSNTEIMVIQRRKFATVNLPVRDLSQAFFRTDVSNPAEHNDLHHGLFYRIPNDIANRLFLLGGFDKNQQEMLKVFQETAIMIRKPALEVIDYLRRTDFSKPPNSYMGQSDRVNHLL
ncbi:hypothetical protein BLA29_001834 [Euroglyphus maynei]|uniref:Small ribosomal subunit protein mS29 n=1 Tax=Euroglyphus maynei TaxID=6958 RepID=A0A1Y3BUX9_EURMA|nr:hypothetical protein BLA29_001834 [Euroglyphus maynei]